tara:strand:- start:4550 stop:4957 length:408 start_codon:yes stop_codon:yes gene_type:complete
MTGDKSIYDMTADEVYDVYENTGVSIAMQTALAAGDGQPTVDALAAGARATNSFMRMIMAEGGKSLDETTQVSKWFVAGCTMLWMGKMMDFLDTQDRERFPEGPATLIEHITAYSILTEQDWESACKDILKGGEA